MAKAKGSLEARVKAAAVLIATEHGSEIETYRVKTLEEEAEIEPKAPSSMQLRMKMMNDMSEAVVRDVLTLRPDQPLKPADQDIVRITLFHAAVEHEIARTGEKFDDERHWHSVGTEGYLARLKDHCVRIQQLEPALFFDSVAAELMAPAGARNSLGF